MNKILLMLTIFSLTMCGTMYLSYDVSSDMEWENALDEDFDDGAIMIGYNHGVWSNESGVGIAVGFNYGVTPSSWDVPGTNNQLEFDTYSVYMLTEYSVNDQVVIWGSLGYGFADSDQLAPDEDIEGGLTGGLGVYYKISDTWGVGLGYGCGNYTVTETGSPDADLEMSRISMSFGYSF